MSEFLIEWRTGVGYGDFVTGLGYARNCTIRYQRPVTINFHWSHSKDFLFHKSDPETIINRCDYVNSVMLPVTNLHVVHTFSSFPKFRFINQLEEFNPLHGLSYASTNPTIEPLVVLWTTEHNVSFPGSYKDPVHPKWNLVKQHLLQSGFAVEEVTYRSPISTVVNLINRCCFGVGYDGLIHQMFKFMWKPLLVFCKRVELNTLLVPQAVIETTVENFINTPVNDYIEKSKERMNKINRQYNQYLCERINPNEHPLYNTPIY